MTTETATTVPVENNSESPVSTNTHAFIISDKTVYNSVEELHKGAIEKEIYIGQLVNELKQLKEQVVMQQNTKTLEEELKRMSENLSQSNGQPVQTPTSQPDTNTIEEIAKRVYERQQAEIASSRNVDSVMNELNKTYGSEAANKLEAKLKELNMTKEQVTALAANNPTAAMKLLDLSSPAPRPVDFTNLYQKTINAPVTAPVSDTDIMRKRLREDYKDVNKMAKLIEEVFADPSKLAGLQWNKLEG